jgi:hypothetical protein
MKSGNLCCWVVEHVVVVDDDDDDDDDDDGLSCLMMDRKGGVPQVEIRMANTTDPTPFLESRGLRVVWEGRHGYLIESDRKAYRISLKDDGR